MALAAVCEVDVFCELAVAVAHRATSVSSALQGAGAATADPVTPAARPTATAAIVRGNVHVRIRDSSSSVAFTPLSHQ